MNYNQATLRAATGDILMLPGWHGYFKWNFEKNELYFQNGDYYLNDGISNFLEEISRLLLMLLNHFSHVQFCATL